jgi:DNA-binding CsgD family transcriptional regulator
MVAPPPLHILTDQPLSGTCCAVDHQRLANHIAEIARQADSASSFRQQSLETLAAEVGAAGGTICSSVVVEGRMDGMHVLSGQVIENRFPVGFFSQLTVDEVKRSLTGFALRERDVIPGSRRDRLVLFNEYLSSIGVQSCAVRCWLDKERFQFIALASQGKGDASRFYGRTLPALDQLFSIIALGERLHRVRQGSRQGTLASLWLRDLGLTLGECQVIDLVERGLTNREVASILSLSPNTVRNYLATTFRKLDVTTRAELVFVLAEAKRLSMSAGCPGSICLALAQNNSRPSRKNLP